MLASYKTERGADRYIKELRKKYPNREFIRTVNEDFTWGVGAVDGQGRVVAQVDRRPKNFGRNA